MCTLAFHQEPVKNCTPLDSWLVGGRGTLAQCLKAASKQARWRLSTETQGLEAYIDPFSFSLYTYTVLRVVVLWTLTGHHI